MTKDGFLKFKIHDFTTDVFRVVAFLQHQLLHLIVCSSSYHTAAIDFVLDRTLLSFLSKLNHQILRLHIAAHSPQRVQPIINNFFCYLLTAILIDCKKKKLTPLLLELIATIGLQVLVFGL